MGVEVVYLIGAGPGNVGLLTVRAAELIRSADVVVHEGVTGRTLELVRPGCEVVGGEDEERVAEVLIGTARPRPPASSLVARRVWGRG